MKKNTRYIIGALLVIFGLLFLFNALDWIHLDLFFKGWWTLFIIIPAIYSIVTNGAKFWNTFFLIIGICLFLNEYSWQVNHYLIPAILVSFGVYLLCKKN